MAKVSPVINNFNTGEVSPLVQARTDIDRLRAGVSLLQNYIPTIQGGATKRPGTKFVAAARTVSVSNVSTKYPTIRAFEFSNTQAYVIEFNQDTERVRFYKDRAQIQLNGTPYEINNPYSYTDIYSAQFFQSNDVLFITHPSHKPRKLVRRGDTDWAFEEIVFEDGPYLPINYPKIGKPGILTTSSVSQNGTTTVQAFVAAISTITRVPSSNTHQVVTTTEHGLVSGNRVAIYGEVSSNLLWNFPSGSHSLQVTVGTAANAFTVDSSDGALATDGFASAGSVYWAVFNGTADTGRQFRIRQSYSPSQWVWGTLAYQTPTSNAGVMNFINKGTNTLNNSGTHPEFRLGVWGTGNYPATAVIHEDRLTFYGAPLDPARVDMSNSSDYENFSPSDPDGTVSDDHAISFPLASNGVQVGVWLASDEKGLLAGSEGQEWVVRPSSNQEALTPTNISAKPTSSWGGIGGIGAVKFGKSVLFVQRAGRKLMEYRYFYDADGFRCEDLTTLAEHITLTGVRQIALQKVPQPILWVLRNDGVLLGLTYNQYGEEVFYGWHRHPVGGYVNAAGSPAQVKSIAVIPSTDGTTEDLWMVVHRWINGQNTFQVEYMTEIFDESKDIEDAFFVDSGLTYNNALTVSSISSVATNSVLVTITSHGLSNLDRIRINGVVGLSGLNGVDYLVSAASTSTFILQTTGTVNVAYGTLSSSGTNSYVSGGSASKWVGTVTGLGHLEGQVVDILANGTAQVGTVSGSACVISGSAFKAHIGLNYESKIKTLRIDAGAIDGTSMGKFQRSARVGLVLDQQGPGLEMGRSFSTMSTVPIEDGELPLFSGVKDELFEDEYTRDNRIYLKHAEPVPSTILAILPHMVTQDGG